MSSKHTSAVARAQAGPILRSAGMGAFLHSNPQIGYEIGFNPKAVPSLQLWLDGADASTIVFGTQPAIQQWNDKSGKANNATQNTAINQPTQAVADANGLSTVKLTQLNNLFFNIPSIDLSATGYTVFCVGKKTAAKELIGLGTTVAVDAEAPLYFSDDKVYFSAPAGAGTRNV